MSQMQSKVAALVGRPAFWILFVGIVFTLPVVRSVRAKLPPPPPVLGTVGEFMLTDQEGHPFGSADLRGRVWVADFIFTRCPTVCPLLTERMAKVQHRSRNLGPAFALVSFSVDPEYDTPERLLAYAHAHKASPRMWTFLTGPYDVIRRAVVDQMKVSMGKDPASGIFHGSHLVLIDPRMRIRGYYDVTDEGGIDTLMRDIGLLVARGG